MLVNRQLLTPREAAQQMGISYPTVKKCILDGKLETIKTPGGHHRITPASIKAFLERKKATYGHESRERYPQISGINQLRGEVVSIRFAGLVAEVVLAIGDGKITAIIPADTANELELNIGDIVTALVKQSDVMVGRIGDRQK